LGYDTIYAAQDRDDDIRLGLHSLAPKVAGRPRYYIGAFYAVAVLLWGLAAWLAGLSPWTLLGLSAVAGHLAWQVVRLEFDLAARCLALFRANFWTGLLLCGAYLLCTLV
jgi:4-hydroxybenzoate polyprenyltransferase